MKNVIIGVSAQAVLLVFFFLLLESKREKTAFIRLEKVYEDFSMKKDLEKKFKGVEEKRKSILDSLELNLTLLYQHVSKQPTKELVNNYETMKETYFVKKQQFDEDNQKVMEQYHKQIIDKINDYASSYGKNHGYQYIYGTDGSGSLMYSNENNDVTGDFLNYINNNYRVN